MAAGVCVSLSLLTMPATVTVANLMGVSAKAWCSAYVKKAG
jgi:hypothetical protein